MTADISLIKARSSAASGLHTAKFADFLSAMPALAALPHFVGAAGGVPLIHAGECIGAIGASGGTAEQDAQAAQAGSASMLTDA
jgi:glc operon protein GlcG